MRKYKLIYLLAIVLALGIAIYLSERTAEKSETARFSQIGFNQDKISKVEINRTFEGLQQQLVFTKKNNIWEISGFTGENAIRKMNADSDYLNDLLEKLEQTNFEKISESNPTGANQNQFRLDNPIAKISLTDLNNNKFQLNMSERKNFEGYPYYRLNNATGVYTSNVDFSAKFLNKIIYFQLRHILDKDFEKFDRIKVITPNTEFELTTKVEFSSKKINGLIAKIKNLTVQDYLTDSSGKLEKKMVTIEILSKDFVWKMHLSLNYKDKKLYAMVNQNSGPSVTVEFDTSYWAYFANLNKNQFTEIHDKN